MPFVRWYLAVASAFAVHHVFTGALDLANPKQSDDLGRTAMLYLVNAVVVGVMVVMAAEATAAMDQSHEGAVAALPPPARRCAEPNARSDHRPAPAPKTLPPAPPVSAPVAQVPALGRTRRSRPPLTPES